MDNIFIISFTQADFIQNLMNLTEGLNQLSLNDSEMALFSAAVLLSPDRPVINDPKTIGQHQERITDALRLQVQYPRCCLIWSNRNINLINIHFFFLF